VTKRPPVPEIWYHTPKRSLSGSVTRRREASNIRKGQVYWLGLTRKNALAGFLAQGFGGNWRGRVVLGCERLERAEWRYFDWKAGEIQKTENYCY